MNRLQKFFSAIKELTAKPVFNTFMGWGSSSRTWARRDMFYGIIFSCIDAIATSVSSNDYDLIKKNVKGDKTELDDHPAYQLLKKPNKFQTDIDLMYLISSQIDAFGKAFIYPVKSPSGEPVELWALMPNKMQIVAGMGFIAGYVYTNPKGEKIPFEADEIVPIFRPNPFNQYDGISTIEMSRRAIEADLNAQDFNTKFFENGASPSGVLSTEGSLDDDAFERLKQQWHNKYEGKENAHKTLVLESGLKYQQVQISQRDMDYVNQRRFTRDELLSIFKVPKSILAITDDVNRANAETGDYVFSSRVVKPRLDLIFEKLNRFYLPMFKNANGLELEAHNPVPEDKVQELAYDSASVNKWETVNEVRARHNKEPLEGGDEIVTPQSPFGAPAPTAPVKGIMTKALKDRKYITAKRVATRELTRKLQLKVEQHLKILQKDIKNKSLEGLRKKGIESMLSDLVPDLNNWTTLLSTIILDFQKNGFKTGVELTSEAYDLPKDIHAEHSGAYAILVSRANTSADQIAKTVLERARLILADNIDKPDMTLNKLRDELVTRFDDLKDYQAERIARTEMGYAVNQGSMQDMNASGLVSQVKWITAGSPCEICDKNNEEVIKMGGTFASGDLIPPAHPNCECDVVPYFD